ncbi:MAG: anti-sigma factor [Gemmatimonadota bacterium]|nr:anti-sigma factor [Gemmatimonadota bacterium]
MSHEEARTLLAAEALDSLTGSEREAVLAHVAQCRECASELAALRNGAAAMAWLVPFTPLAAERSQGVRARLLARLPVRASGEGAFARPGTDPSARRPGDLHKARAVTAARGIATRSWSPGWLAAAVVLVVACELGASLLSAHSDRDALRRQLVALRAGQTAMTTQLAGLDSIIAGLAGPEVQIVRLAAPGPSAPAGRMFWNQSTHRWTFVASNLPQPRTGRRYQLWLVTNDDRRISAGMFTPSETGIAVVNATYELPRQALAAVAVTDEPATGSPQPTTTPFLVGTVGQSE